MSGELHQVLLSPHELGHDLRLPEAKVRLLDPFRVYDTNGAVQWTATHASPSALDDEATAVAFDGDGNVIVAGYELDPVIPWRMRLAKHDPAGGLLWAQVWDGETWARRAAPYPSFTQNRSTLASSWLW